MGYFIRLGTTFLNLASASSIRFVNLPGRKTVQVSHGSTVAEFRWGSPEAHKIAQDFLGLDGSVEQIEAEMFASPSVEVLKERLHSCI